MERDPIESRHSLVRDLHENTHFPHNAVERIVRLALEIKDFGRAEKTGGEVPSNVNDAKTARGKPFVNLETIDDKASERTSAIRHGR
jgi:hypothetical protein